jgi:hypothetical protein
VFGGGKAEAARQRRIGFDQSQDVTRRGAARGKHQRHIVIFADRQHALGGGLDQPLVVDRAKLARQAVERLETDAEALAERAQIIFLADRAAGDQHPVAADPNFGRAILRRGQHVGAKQVADAGELGARAGADGGIVYAGGPARILRRHDWRSPGRFAEIHSGAPQGATSSGAKRHTPRPPTPPCDITAPATGLRPEIAIPAHFPASHARWRVGGGQFDFPPVPARGSARVAAVRERC